jgi:hypothetical protein
MDKNQISDSQNSFLGTACGTCTKAPRYWRRILRFPARCADSAGGGERGTLSGCVSPRTLRILLQYLGICASIYISRAE